eukprot:12446726-Ditylum_brightwellii.AAC.1
MVVMNERITYGTAVPGQVTVVKTNNKNDRFSHAAAAAAEGMHFQECNCDHQPNELYRSMEKKRWNETMFILNSGAIGGVFSENETRDDIGETRQKPDGRVLVMTW